ncbi:hypothetical protein TSUD_41610 [Trifolium subterraneum]|nr:hypothetical protein TSUD_41610 [Trifolium subterraneum]
MHKTNSLAETMVVLVPNVVNDGLPVFGRGTKLCQLNLGLQPVAPWQVVLHTLPFRHDCYLTTVVVVPGFVNLTRD